MDITSQNLDLIFRQAALTYQSTLTETPTVHEQIATTIPMATRQLTQGWLDRIPQLRKWKGNRSINNVIAHARVIEAEPYENTVALSKWDVKDDQLGLFNATVQMLGQSAKKWPDNLLANFLFTEAATVLGYDGVPVFSTAHPLQGGVDGGLTGTQSNLSVSTALTLANYIAVREAMMARKGADGAPLVVEPDVLMVPPQLWGEAKKILESDVIALAASTATSNAGETNVWKNTARIIVNPWLSNMPNNWWLLDTRAAVKPFAFFQLDAPSFTYLTSPTDPNVFNLAEFLYGVEARGAASETVWWLSHAATSEAAYYPA